MNLRDEVEKIKTEGYSEANAESKLCQDIGFQEDAVTKSGKNWLDVPVDAVLKKDLEFIKSL